MLRPFGRVVIGMLEGDDLLLPRVIIRVLMNRLVVDRRDPGNAGGIVDLDLRGEIGAIVEGADGDLQPAGMAIGQRRAAGSTEATGNIDRRLEIVWFVARPLKAVLRRRHQRAEEAAESLLAHAAMADGRA